MRINRVDNFKLISKHQKQEARIKYSEAQPIMMKTISPCFSRRSNFYNSREKRYLRFPTKTEKKKRKNGLEIAKTGVSRFELIMGPVV